MIFVAPCCAEPGFVFRNGDAEVKVTWSKTYVFEAGELVAEYPTRPGVASVISALHGVEVPRDEVEALAYLYANAEKHPCGAYRRGDKTMIHLCIKDSLIGEIIYDKGCRPIHARPGGLSPVERELARLACVHAEPG